MEDETLRCTGCRKILDGGSNAKQLFLEGDTTPKRMERVPGATVVCAYCRKLSRFTKTGVLVPMTPFEFQKLPKADRDALRATQAYLAQAMQDRPS